MTDENRQHKRITKPLNVRFCNAADNPPKWDMTTIENISTGGTKFVAHINIQKDDVLKLQIRIPQLAPRILELTAVVVENTKRPTMSASDVRVKFVNLTPSDTEDLSVLEKIK